MTTKSIQKSELSLAIKQLQKKYYDTKNKKIEQLYISKVPKELIELLLTKSNLYNKKLLYIKVGSQGTSHPFSTQIEQKRVREDVFQLLLEIGAKGYFAAFKLKGLTELLDINKENIDNIKSNFATHIIFYFPKENTTSTLPLCCQKIVFGAPGTGKSYLIEAETNKPNMTRFRTVFHPETSSADFFGHLEPVTKYQSMSPLIGHVSDSNIEYALEGLTVAKQSASIVYEFAPGPFMRAVKSAIHNPEKPHALVIEEINRAHAAAVFGEVFQLLDREDSGWSRYPIVISDSAFRYLETDTLASNLLDKNSIKIPPNLSLYATMNTADQGVYPMDTAFKRRWQFTYVPLNGKTDNWKDGDWNPQIPMLDCRWQELRVTINAYLLEKSRTSKIEMPIPEDKLIGPYFLSKNELSNQNINDSIIEKVLFYLQFDVLKYSPTALFVQSLTMSEIREISVAGKLMESFHKDFQDALAAQKIHKEVEKEGSLESNNAE